MEQKGHYRHELKYNISYWQYLQIRSRLRQVMQMDPHTGKDGTYRIRSIYFDNLQDKALREKVDGVAKRENSEFVTIMIILNRLHWKRK